MGWGGWALGCPSVPQRAAGGLVSLSRNRGTRPRQVCARDGALSHICHRCSVRWARASTRSASRSRLHTTTSTAISIARWQRAPPPPPPPPPRRHRRSHAAAMAAAEVAAAAAATPRPASPRRWRLLLRALRCRLRQRWCAARRRWRPRPTRCAWLAAPRCLRTFCTLCICTTPLPKPPALPGRPSAPPANPPPSAQPPAPHHPYTDHTHNLPTTHPPPSTLPSPPQPARQPKLHPLNTPLRTLCRASCCPTRCPSTHRYPPRRARGSSPMPPSWRPQPPSERCAVPWVLRRCRARRRRGRWLTGTRL